MPLALRPGHARPAFFGLALLLLVLIAYLASVQGSAVFLASALGVGLIMMGTVYQLLAQAEARAASAEAEAQVARDELQSLRSGQEARSAPYATLQCIGARTFSLRARSGSPCAPSRHRVDTRRSVGCR